MLRELRTFVAIARDGSFAAAGQRIGLTQAAVSAQMQRLEAALGFALFERAGRTARLNDRGLITLRQAQALIDQFASLGTMVDPAIEARTISVGAIASLQRSVLADLLPAFYRDFPNQPLRIVPGVSMQLVDLVDAGELDMALIIRPPFGLHGDLEWTAIAQEPFRLIVHRKVRGDDWAAIVRNEPFIRYDRSSFGGRQVEQFLRREQLDVREICEVDELDVIVTLVARQVGVALLPQTVGHWRWPAAVRAIDLGTRTFHREVGLVYRSQAGASAMAHQLIERITAARHGGDDVALTRARGAV